MRLIGKQPLSQSQANLVRLNEISQTRGCNVGAAMTECRLLTLLICRTSKRCIESNEKERHSKSF